MSVPDPEAPEAKKARNNTVSADAGAGNKEIHDSGTYTSLHEEDYVGHVDSVEQAANSGGQQKVGTITVPNEEQRMKMALLELKKQNEETRAELTINDNLMKCSHRIKTMYFSHQKFVHFGKMSGLDEGRLRNWLRQSLKLQQVEFDNIWPRLRTQITRTLRVKRSGCASAMKYHFYGKSSKCSRCPSQSSLSYMIVTGQRVDQG